METLFAPLALLPTGWTHSVRLEIGDAGRILRVDAGVAARAGDRHLAGRVLLPAPANLHSHAFQRAMAGMTERRGDAPEGDSFWTWRELMYRFLERLDPDDIEAIAAFVQMEMLEAGYAAVAEFHYLHHGPDGRPYDAPAELAQRICAAAARTGIGLTLLPVLYGRGGCDGRPLQGGQRRFGADLDGFVPLVEGA
ncbi:MAG: formimidoylglutamate deiminase, partial [Pseudomonadota bacterium]